MVGDAVVTAGVPSPKFHVQLAIVPLGEDDPPPSNLVIERAVALVTLNCAVGACAGIALTKPSWPGRRTLVPALGPGTAMGMIASSATTPAYAVVPLGIIVTVTGAGMHTPEAGTRGSTQLLPVRGRDTG